MSGVRPFASEATRGARVALGGVILGTLLGVAGVSSPVLAYEASCVPGRGHDNAARYAVTSGHVSGINGLSSTILELNPYYSGSNSTGTNSSIMLLRWSPTQWAQLGWIKSKLYGGTVTRKVFLEFYLGPSQNYYRFWGGRQIQTQTWYEILYEAPSTFNFFVAGSYVATMSGFTPSDYQMFSETHDLADQMPGTSSNVETFRSSAYFTGAQHGQQHLISGSMSTDTRYYGAQKVSSGTYYAWDKCGVTGLASAGVTLSGRPSTTIPSGVSSIAPDANAMLAPEDMPVFGIATAVDVTETPDTALPQTSVGRALALAAAQREIGVGAGTRVYSGTASRFPGNPVQAVWIVTTPGGVAPSDGPLGGPGVPPVRLSGVIVDAATGEIWSGFMR